MADSPLRSVTEVYSPRPVKAFETSAFDVLRILYDYGERGRGARFRDMTWHSIPTKTLARVLRDHTSRGFVVSELRTSPFLEPPRSNGRRYKYYFITTKGKAAFARHVLEHLHHVLWECYVIWSNKVTKESFDVLTNLVLVNPQDLFLSVSIIAHASSGTNTNSEKAHAVKE